MHAFTSENDIVVNRQITLAFIKLKHFKSFLLNDVLISEAWNDSGGEIDTSLKRKVFIHENKIFSSDM